MIFPYNCLVCVILEKGADYVKCIWCTRLIDIVTRVTIIVGPNITEH